MKNVLLLVLTLLSGCGFISWMEVEPKPFIDELVEVYGLPLPVSQPQKATYRAAIQPLGGREFVVMRADLSLEISEKVEAVLAPNPRDRPPSRVIDYITPANDSINWWLAAGTFKARKYNAKPKGLDASLLEVFFVQDVTPPYILFVMTPKSVYTEAMKPSANQ